MEFNSAFKGLISVLLGSSGSWLINMLCFGEVQNSIFDLWIGYYD
jgi:hypothetical protein